MAILFLWISPAFGEQEKNLRTVVVEEGQNVRELADAYLGDPDLWGEILRVNHLNSPADVKPGMILQLPPDIINKARNELAKARESVDEASRAGAKIFAPALIAEAIQLHNDALAKRKAGDWNACFSLAGQASEKAGEAVERSQDQGGLAGEAILTERKGRVQSRKPSDQLWKDLPLYFPLVEGERVRTLSESYAEIRFRKGERIQLTENSQIVISKMRGDTGKNKEEKSSVSLIKGDAFVLLEGKNQPFVRDKDRASVHRGKMLASPRLISPVNGTTVLFSADLRHIHLEWEGIPDAAAYWLEIASDRSFENIILSQRAIKQTHFRQEIKLKDGVYYWRAAAVNIQSFPGINSKERFFRVVNDNIPPYVIILSPISDEILTDNPVRVLGEIEPGAVLSLKGRSIDIRRNGSFSFEYPLTKGRNNILLEAEDMAGNITRLSRSLVFSPNTDVPIRYDAGLPLIAPRHFITRDRAFHLSGETEPGSGIAVHASENTRSMLMQPGCFADDKGRFRLNLSLGDGKTEFVLLVSSLGGHVTRDTFIVETDRQPPEIRLGREPPSVSVVQRIRLYGNISEKSFISLNDKSSPHMGDSFDESVELKPGVNFIRLTARDQAGNLGFWEKSIVFDRKPPIFSAFTSSPDMALGGESLNIGVSAEDESGLKVLAEFEIRVGEYAHTGFLRLNTATRIYQGTVRLPKQAAGKVELSYVKLSDYVGNEKAYDLR